MKRWEIQHTLQIAKGKEHRESLLTVLLKNRGITTDEDKKTFLNPRLEDVTVAAVGIDKKQLTKAIKRITKALEGKEHIIVFGDYDVDGITGSAILWESLYSLKAQAMPYIPHRIDEGYGLSIKGIDNVKAQYPDTALIITVDNGIVASKAVAYAKEHDIDVIITDHHTPPVGEGETLPDAHAIVHTTKLCGAGVAYLLSKELKKQYGKENDDDTHLELAALGTVADLVPLTGANRAIVKFGLQKLSKTKRKGLLALFREAACDISSLEVYHIGYIIAPRLNASGRIEHAMDSLRLLCTTDDQKAEMLAEKLGATNRERQTLMRESASHAVAAFRTSDEELKKILFIGHESYQQGIIGLVAGKLVEEYYRPSIVLSIGETYSKASVRSVHGFNVIDFLRKASDFLVDVGGHPMAAGFTVETEKIDQLRQKLEELIHVDLPDDLLTRLLRIDCEIDLSTITFLFHQVLQQLSPFGMNNPEPTFVTRNVTVNDKRLLGKEKKHVKFMISAPNAEMEAIGFGMAEQGADIQIGDKIDIVYSVAINEWQGRQRLQLKIKDFKKTD